MNGYGSLIRGFAYIKCLCWQNFDFFFIVLLSRKGLFWQLMRLVEPIENSVAIASKDLASSVCFIVTLYSSSI